MLFCFVACIFQKQTFDCEKKLLKAIMNLYTLADDPINV